MAIKKLEIELLQLTNGILFGKKDARVFAQINEWKNQPPVPLPTDTKGKDQGLILGYMQDILSLI